MSCVYAYHKVNVAKLPILWTDISVGPLKLITAQGRRAAEHFETWGWHPAMNIPLLKFSKLPFALCVGTSNPLCNLYYFECVCDRFVNYFNFFRHILESFSLAFNLVPTDKM